MGFMAYKKTTKELLDIHKRLTDAKDELFKICKEIDDDINKSSINPINDDYWKIIQEIVDQLGTRTIKEHNG